MLNKCPEEGSCGAYSPFWTDDKMPCAPGRIHNITVYGYLPNFINGLLDRFNGCRYYKKKAQVMRCSWDTEYDFVYRYDDEYEDRCVLAFCGMT